MPKIVDNETDDEVNNTILAVKPKLKRSTAVEADPEPAAPKPKKERTPAQLAALEKGRARAKEKADLRKAAKVSQPIDIPQPIPEVDDDPDSDDTRVQPKPRKTTAYRRPTPEDNGWKAFAEYMVKEKETKRQSVNPRFTEPEPEVTTPPRKDPPKTVKVVAPKKEILAVKKIPRFS
tara:strand:+ start:7152 stop:7682 length:531 start_codon:yes stop_codon:yes gene_type:complete